MTIAHRSSLALRAAATALLLCAPPARAAPPGPRADYPLFQRVELEGALGLAVPFESGVDTGFKLNGAVHFGVVQLAPHAVLQLGGNLGWTHNDYFGGSLDAVDLLPQVRVRVAVSPAVFLFGDGGLGLAVVRASYSGFSDTSTRLLLKLGGGIGFPLHPGLSLAVEPAFHVYTGSPSATQFTLLGALLYRP